MPWHVWMLLAVNLVPAADGRRADAGGELPKLGGTWQITSVEREGHKIHGFTKCQLIVADDTITVKENNQPLFKGAVTLDPSKTPKAIDWSIDSGDGKSQTALGIYSLDGDDLKLCWGQPGKERPAGFTAKAGTSEMVMVLKRDQK
jgi:uncharacterized protein (TIGR03067 family)